MRDFVNGLAERVIEATRAAAEATVAAAAEDGVLEVGSRFRAELASRGILLESPDWTADVVDLLQADPDGTN